MLIVPEAVQRANHNYAKQGLRDTFNKEFERILNDNASVDTYWVLGKVRFPDELGGQVGRVFMERSDAQPPFVKDSFVYHVDNRRGVKELLWISNRDSLYIAPLGKVIEPKK